MDELKIKSKLEKIFAEFPELDNPEYILRVSDVEYYRKVNQYSEKLKSVLMETLKSAGMGAAVAITVKEFNEIMKTYEARLRKMTMTQKDLLREIIKQYNQFYSGVVEDIKKRTIQKAVSLKTQAKLLAIPKSYEKSVLGQTLTLSDGSKIMTEELSQTYKNIEKRYGTRMTIRYGGNGPNGKNYPLTAYLDARQATTTTTMKRITSQIMAAQQGVYTFKIDFNGTTDSCKFWEGKIGFYSDAAKSAFLTEFPNYPEASKWPTLQYLTDVDTTHIFKFNCRHGALPYPIQFFDPVDQEKAVRENTAPVIPDKINERQLEEEGRLQNLTVGIQ